MKVANLSMAIFLSRFLAAPLLYNTHIFHHRFRSSQHSFKSGRMPNVIENWKVVLNLWHVWIAVKMTMLKGNIQSDFVFHSIVWVEWYAPVPLIYQHLKVIVFYGRFTSMFSQTDSPHSPFLFLYFSFTVILIFFDLHSSELRAKFIVNQFKIYEQNYFVCLDVLRQFEG